MTNTFGASRFKLDKSGNGERTGELNRLGVSLSKKAAGKDCYVFASIGPTGELVKPYGEKTEEELVECFMEQIEACVEAGADGILIESMMDLTEAKAALKAVRIICALPAVVSMTFEKGNRDLLR